MKVLVHGAISHGLQVKDPARAREATAYYAPGSGVGQTLAVLSGENRRVGVIGLGVGTLATYGRAGDVFRFYEINPQDAAFARDEFSFLRDSAAKTEVLLGDGRLTLEAEPVQNYDLLVVDAFSGDSIPAHLLSVEAFRLYLKHLSPQGVLAFHVSNDHLDLAPVTAAVARANGMEARLVNYNAPPNTAASSSSWVLTGPGLKSYPRLANAGAAIHPGKMRPWTDDFSNLLTALKH
jgi:spermidine synthase